MANTKKVRDKIRSLRDGMEQIEIYLVDINDQLDEGGWTREDLEEWARRLNEAQESIDAAEDELQELAGRTEED